MNVPQASRVGGWGMIGSAYFLEASQEGHIVGHELLHFNEGATLHFIHHPYWDWGKAVEEQWLLWM